MSKFPAAFLSYFTGNDFYDNVGRNAPATRISIELPAELVDWSSKSGDPPYTPQPVEPKLLADIQNAVMRKYGGKARNNINAFRQERSFSDFGMISRLSALDNGVGMRWSSQLGNEYVDIRVSPEAVRKLLGESSEDRYMLIYYKKDGGYKFAAILMSKIDNPSSSDVIINKRSNLNLIYPEFSANISCVQMKIASDTHVVATHLNIDKNGNASVSGPLNAGTSVYYYNSNNTIIGGIKGPKTPDYNGFTTINWNKRTVFDAVGNKVVFGSKIEATANSPWVTSNVVQAVTETGGLYSQPIVVTADSTVGITPSAGGVFSASQASQLVSVNATPNILVKSYYGGPGESGFTAQYPTGTTSSGSGSVTATCYFNIYSNNGSVDKITLGSTIARGHRDFDNTTTPSVTYNQDVSIWGIAASSSYASNVYSRSGPANISPMPGYGLGTALSDNWVGWDEDGYTTGTAQTPFGRFAAASTPQPQIWAANGKTYICKFLYFDYALGDNRGKIYKDKKEYGSKLKSAVGIKNELDVLAIFLDIKLSDIQKLK